MLKFMSVTPTLDSHQGRPWRAMVMVHVMSSCHSHEKQEQNSRLQVLAQVNLATAGTMGVSCLLLRSQNKKVAF